MIVEIVGQGGQFRQEQVGFWTESMGDAKGSIANTVDCRGRVMSRKSEDHETQSLPCCQS